MNKDFSDTRIEYVKSYKDGRPFYQFKVYTDVDEYAKISGHRFVSLVNERNMFKNDLDVLLGFLKRKPFIDTDYMEAGRKLEEPVIELASRLYEMKDVKSGYSFEDLKEGTDDFHFIRDLEYTNENGERVTGEIKTFSNKKKVEWVGKIPKVSLDWWLQVRLEIEILKDIGGKGRVFFYYVDDTLRNAVLKGRPWSLKPKNLYASDYIEKFPEGAPEDMIVENFGHLDIYSFSEVMDYALEKRDDLLTLYEDDKGKFYYAEAHISYPFFKNFNHIERDLNELSEYLNIIEKDDF